jgi:hypothetical protein
VRDFSSQSFHVRLPACQVIQLPTVYYSSCASRERDSIPGMVFFDPRRSLTGRTGSRWLGPTPPNALAAAFLRPPPLCKYGVFFQSANDLRG